MDKSKSICKGWTGRWQQKEITREHRPLLATNGNQKKLTVHFVGLFLLLVLDWKTLVLMSGDLPLQMRWC